MRRPGFTLLEVILALALTIVVLGLLGMAVDVHLRVADAGRNEVEETQSARLLLRQMADDLRRALPVTRASFSIGCLRGTKEELQVDVSRMPLLEDVQTATSPRDNRLPVLPPSDVQTITYFVAKPEDLAFSQTSDPDKPKRGLLRREWERATFAWAVQQGQTDKLNLALKSVSPEVESIEFAYIDGSTTYQEWDSAEQKKLPSAVKIAIAIRQPWRKPRGPSLGGIYQQNPTAVYSMIVDLPNSRATLDKTLASIVEQPAPAAAPASQETKPTESPGQETTPQNSEVKEIKPISPMSGGVGR